MVKIIRKGFEKFILICKEYCLSSSLIGMAYIANSKYHIAERIFWLICVIITLLCSYILMDDYRESFEKDAISIVEEDLRPSEWYVDFPSVAVCEVAYIRHDYVKLEEFVEGLTMNGTYEYNEDVEEYLLTIAYQDLYRYSVGGSLKFYCSQYFDCDDCMKCPEDGYMEIAHKIRANCSELFQVCKWNGIQFDCCRYFLPLQTTVGKCYLLNSIQTAEKKGKRWLDMKVDVNNENAQLELHVNHPVAFYVLNKEDIPHILLTAMQFTEPYAGSERTVRLNMMTVFNDPKVRGINPVNRKCKFPNEQRTSNSYKYYSFSVCVAECLKQTQLKTCNCTNYNMIVEEKDRSPRCDLRGFFCLDEHDILYPQTIIMQPWRANGLACNCLPSCEDHEIQIVENTFKKYSERETRTISIGLQSVPRNRYRTQLRSQLDAVVSVGGILSLFMGASILSAIELLYFFFVRIIGDIYV